MLTLARFFSTPSLNLPDSLPDLYTVRSLPDRPQKGFFANLMGGSKKLDREALCKLC